MFMEDLKPVQNHVMTMKNRNFLQLCGIVDVVSFDAEAIFLETSCGMLLIKGRELHMNHLSLEKGEVYVDGTVDSLMYSEAHKAAKQAQKLVGRLFK